MRKHAYLRLYTVQIKYILRGKKANKESKSLLKRSHGSKSKPLQIHIWQDIVFKNFELTDWPLLSMTWIRTETKEKHNYGTLFFFFLIWIFIFLFYFVLFFAYKFRLLLLHILTHNIKHINKNSYVLKNTHKRFVLFHI